MDAREREPSSGAIKLGGTFPRLNVEFIGKANDEQFSEYLRVLDAHLLRCIGERKKSVLVVDTLKATSPVSASQRKLQAEWMARTFQRSAQTLVGMAFVIDNIVVRGVLTAILWLQKMPCEYAVFGTRGEAEHWADSKLSPEGAKSAATAR